MSGQLTVRGLEGTAKLLAVALGEGIVNARWAVAIQPLRDPGEAGLGRLRGVLKGCFAGPEYTGRENELGVANVRLLILCLDC